MLQYLSPLAWLRWSGQFFSAWVQSIPWRNVPNAIPAVILLIVLTVTAAIAYTEGSGWRNRRIDDQLATAFEVDDFDTAELLIVRQIEAAPDDVSLLFDLALVRDQQKSHDEAVALMRELVAKKQHVAAAKWLLQNQFIGRKWNELSGPERDEYGDLLELINDQPAESLAYQRLLAAYYIDIGTPAKAVPLLIELAKTFPMLGLQAAAIERALGHPEASQRLAEQTLAIVADRYEEEPANGNLAIAIAQIQAFQKRFDQAIQTLRVAVARAGQREQSAMLRQGLADAIAAHVVNAKGQANLTSADRVQNLRLLQEAIQVAPNNPRVLTLIADQMLSSVNDNDDSLREVRESLIAGASPGISHFIQGTAALMKDDSESAVMHLTIAAELLPNSGAILNNLSVAMAARPEPDLDAALKLAQQAIEQAPNPHFYETRGQILLRMEKYLRAVPDLERALAAPSLALKAHQALAVCYAELGDQELSEEHQAAAERLHRDDDSQVVDGATSKLGQRQTP